MSDDFSYLDDYSTSNPFTLRSLNVTRKQKADEVEKSLLSDIGNLLWGGLKRTGADVLTGAEQLSGSDWQIDDELRASAEETRQKVSEDFRNDIDSIGFKEGDRNTVRGWLGALAESAPSTLLYAPAAAMGPVGAIAYAGAAGTTSIGGSSYNSAKEALRSVTNEELLNSPVFIDYYKVASKKHKDNNEAWRVARESFEHDMATDALADGAIIGGLSSAALGPALSKMFKGGQGFVKGVKQGAGVEAVQETFETGVEVHGAERALATAQNREKNWENIRLDTAKGTVLGAGSGGTIGGTMGLLTPNRQDTPPPDWTPPEIIPPRGKFVGPLPNQNPSPRTPDGISLEEFTRANQQQQFQDELMQRSMAAREEAAARGGDQLDQALAGSNAMLEEQSQILDQINNLRDQQQAVEGELLPPIDQLSQDRPLLDRPYIEGSLSQGELPPPQLDNQRRLDGPVPDTDPTPKVGHNNAVSRLEQRRQERLRQKALEQGATQKEVDEQAELERDWQEMEQEKAQQEHESKIDRRREFFESRYANVPGVEKKSGLAQLKQDLGIEGKTADLLNTIDDALANGRDPVADLQEKFNPIRKSRPSGKMPGKNEDIPQSLTPEQAALEQEWQEMEQEKARQEAGQVPDSQEESNILPPDSNILPQKGGQEASPAIKPLSSKKQNLTDEEIDTATKDQIIDSLKDIKAGRMRGLSNVDKDVIRKYEKEGLLDNDEAKRLLKNYRDYWVKREAEGVESDRQTRKQMDRLYGDKSILELEKELTRLSGTISGLQNENEITDNGRRLTSKAVSNEAARSFGEQKLKLERYIQERRKESKEQTSPTIEQQEAPDNIGKKVSPFETEQPQSILTSSGKPFKTEKSANASAKMRQKRGELQDYTVTPVEGGFAIQPQNQEPVKSATPVNTGVEVEQGIDSQEKTPLNDKQRQSSDLIGATTGEKVKVNQDFDYLKSGQEYTVKLEDNGEITFKSDKGETVIKPGLIRGMMRNKGLKFEKMADQATEGVSPETVTAPSQDQDEQAGLADSATSVVEPTEASQSQSSESGEALLTEDQRETIKKFRKQSSDLEFYATWQSRDDGYIVTIRHKGKVKGQTPLSDVVIGSNGVPRSAPKSDLDYGLKSGRSKPLANIKPSEPLDIPKAKPKNTDGVYRVRGLPSSPTYKKEGEKWYRTNHKGEWVRLSANAKNPLLNRYSVQQDFEDGRLVKETRTKSDEAVFNEMVSVIGKSPTVSDLIKAATIGNKKLKPILDRLSSHATMKDLKVRLTSLPYATPAQYFYKYSRETGLLEDAEVRIDEALITKERDLTVYAEGTASEVLASTITHELIHAATFQALEKKITAQWVGVDTERFGQFSREINRIREEIYKYYKENKGSIEGDLSDLHFKEMISNNHEVITYALTDPLIQKHLQKIPSEKTGTLWTDFVKAIRKVLGIDSDQASLLDDVIKISDQILDSSDLPLSGVEPTEASQSQSSESGTNVDNSNEDSQFLVSEPGTGQSTGRVKIATNQIRKEVGVPLNIVQSESQLPADVQKEIKESKSKGKVKAVHASDGQIYIVADNIKDQKDAVKAYLHEVGHKKVRAATGKKLNIALDQISKSIPQDMEAELRESYKGQLENKSEQEQRRIIADEYVAHLAATDPKNTLLDKVVSIVRNWLRKFAKNIEWTRNDIVEMLVKGGKKLNKEAETDGEVRFSLAGAAEDVDTYDRAYESLGDKDKTIFERIKKTLKRELTPGGLLPTSVFNAKLMRDFDINVSEFDISNRLGHFDQAIQEGYGKPYKKLDEETKNKLNEALGSRNPDNSIPQAVRDEILKMRQHIKGLSEQYAEQLNKEIAQLRSEGSDSEAEAKAALLETITKNLDTYVHRSYRAFDDPKWPKKVSREVYDNAARYLESQYAENGPVTPEIKRKVQQTLELMLEEGTAFDSIEAFIKESKLGAKDLSVLQRRKQIAPEIRALLGEYTDPKVNYAKSVTKMTRLVMNQKFLDKVMELGTTEGFLFTKENRPLDATRRIAAEGSETYSPLNGYYTFPEVEQAFKDALGKEQMADWYRTVVRFNGMVKYGKTVLSPTTALRNWFSASMFALTNGHFNFSHIKKSFESIKEYFTHGEGRDGYLKKLKKLGVIYDTPYAGEMMDLLKDSQLEHDLFDKKPFTSVRRANDIAQKFYQYGDDFWKIVGFENEKAMLMKYKGMTESEAEIEAANRIRNTYPTYSMTGRFVQKLRRFPLAGTFVSFPAEIIRTTYHILRYAKQDMKETPALGRRKLAGLAIAAGLIHAVQAVTMSMMGMDDDEEEAFRDLAAPWQKNSNLAVVGRNKDGQVRIIDMSFMDPYNYWKRPINAIMREQPIDDMLKSAASDAFTPFFGQDIAFSAVTEAITNKKQSGGRVFNPEAPTLDQTVDITNHLRKAIQPGFAANFERIVKASSGHISASGRPYDVYDEMLALFGFRINQFDAKGSIYYKAYEFQDRKRNATQILSSVARNPNEVDDDDIMDAYKTALETRMDAYEDMIRLVKAGMNSGLNRYQIRSALRNSGITKEDANYLVSGRIPQWKPPNSMMRNAIKKAKVLFDDETAREFKRREQVVRKAFMEYGN